MSRANLSLTEWVGLWVLAIALCIASLRAGEQR